MERIGGLDVAHEFRDTTEASGAGDVPEDQTGEGFKACPAAGDVVHVCTNYDSEEALEKEGYDYLLAARLLELIS